MSSELPSRDELMLLNHRGRVAYAVRAALRVEPLCFTSIPGGEVVREANRTAVGFVEGYVTFIAMRVPHAAGSAARAAAAVHAAVLASRVVAEAYSDATALRSDAASAGEIADSDDLRGATLRAATADVEAASAAADAVAYAMRGVTEAGINDPQGKMVAACRRDYLRLLDIAPASTASKDERAGPPFSLSELGPLWPDGVPAWYTHAAAVARVKKPSRGEIKNPVVVPGVVIAWDLEVLPEEDYQRLVTAIGDLVRVEGGDGLKPLEARGFTFALQPEEVRQ